MHKRKRKLFYDIYNGSAIQIVDGDIVYGDIRETSTDRAFEIYTKLAERTKDSVKVLELEYDDYLQDFVEGEWVGIDLDSNKLLFYYPDPNAPAPPEPVYQPPLTEQVAQLKAETSALNLAIIDVWETLAGGGA